MQSSLMKDLFEVLKPGSKEWILANSIDPSRLPAHIAIIMDGNGRWARQRNLPRVAGHRAGIESVRTAVETCSRLGIQALTLYAFSVENWKRIEERCSIVGNGLPCAVQVVPLQVEEVELGCDFG